MPSNFSTFSQPTDPELLSLIERARRLPPPTPEQLRSQCRRYAIAEAGMGSDADEYAYRAALEANDTGMLTRLDAESAQRQARAVQILDEMEL